MHQEVILKFGLQKIRGHGMPMRCIPRRAKIATRWSQPRQGEVAFGDHSDLYSLGDVTWREPPMFGHGIVQLRHEAMEFST